MSQSGDKSVQQVAIEVLPGQVGQGMASQNVTLLVPLLQLGPSEGGEDSIEMKMQAGCRLGLTVAQALVSLGVPLPGRHRKADAVEAIQGLRIQVLIGTEP